MSAFVTATINALPKHKYIVDHISNAKVNNLVY